MNDRINRAQELLYEHVQKASSRSNEPRDSEMKNNGDDAERLERQQRRRDKLQKEAFGSWSKIPFVLKLKLFNGLYVRIFNLSI